MDRNKILEDIEELEDKSWEQGFIGSNERELFLRESIADYIQVFLKVDSKMIGKIIKQPLSQNAVISRFLVAYDKELEQNIYMETVWTDAELSDRWNVSSEHPTKEDARVSCVNLNGL